VPNLKLLVPQKPVAHIVNPARLNIIVPQARLERRQPSQDFRPVINEVNVRNVSVCIETVVVVVKRIGIVV